MKKQLYIEIDDKYLILSLDEKVKEICPINDDSHIAEKLRELAAKAPTAQEKTETTQAPTNGKSDEYQGSALDAAQEIFFEPKVRQGLKTLWEFAQSVSGPARENRRETESEE